MKAYGLRQSGSLTLYCPSTRLIAMGSDDVVTSFPSTTGEAIPGIFHMIFFPVFSNLKEVRRIESTTSADTL